MTDHEVVLTGLVISSTGLDKDLGHVAKIVTNLGKIHLLSACEEVDS